MSTRRKPGNVVMCPMSSNWEYSAAIMLVLAVVILCIGGTQAAAKDNRKARLAKRPTNFNQSPGPEYADEDRMYQGVPTIERAANGRLWAAWFGGGMGEDPGEDLEKNYVMLVTSEDDGKTWSKLKMVIDPPGPVRAFDPCLWHDPNGRLWLFWSQVYHKGEGRNFWVAYSDNSGDENPTWSKPQPLGDGVMINKPIVLSTGEWLLPSAVWRTNGSVRVLCTKDGGQSWTAWGRANVPRKYRDGDEPMMVQRKDGSLLLLVRTKYGIGKSVSTDLGKTWSEVRPWSVKAPTARFHIRRLASGRLLLVKDGPLDKRGERTDLTAYLSDDDGKTWYGGFLLDPRLRVSYPDSVQGPDSTIYVIYDHNRQADKQICMATFTEADVAAGKCVSDKARLKIVVNHARGVNPLPLVQEFERKRRNKKGEK